MSLACRSASSAASSVIFAHCGTASSAASTASAISGKPSFSCKNRPTAASFAPLRTAQAVPPSVAGFVGWAVSAAANGVLGLVLGLMLIPLATRVIGPALAAVKGEKAAH